MNRLNEVLRLKDDEIVWRLVDNEIVILHRGDWQYLTVNETGAILWNRLLDGANRADLVSSLIGQYDVDEETAAGDVDTFLTLLSERDLLTTGVPDGAGG